MTKKYLASTEHWCMPLVKDPAITMGKTGIRPCRTEFRSRRHTGSGRVCFNAGRTPSLSADAENRLGLAGVYRQVRPQLSGNNVLHARYHTVRAEAWVVWSDLATLRRPTAILRQRFLAWAMSPWSSCAKLAAMSPAL